MAEFFIWLGPAKCKRIRLAVMDMWKPFRNVTEGYAPQAAILYDKFHVLQHLGEAMDKVRRSEYKRLTGKPRDFVKGQRYALLTHWKNLRLTRTPNTQNAARSEQAIEYGLCTQRIVSTAVGLRAGRVGTSLLRQLAQRTQMAAA